METKNLRIDTIRTDGGTQQRAELDMDVVADYRELWKAGTKFPPIVVFHDGKDHWLSDGFHRYFSAKHAGNKTIACQVRKGTVRDAILYAVGSNTSHGLRRTNADKRNAVTLLLGDEEWAAKSDRWIAEKCGVSNVFASKIRDELLTVNSSKPGAPRTGRDGKARKPPKKKRRDQRADPPNYSFLETDETDEAEEPETTMKTTTPPKPKEIITGIKDEIRETVETLLEGQPKSTAIVVADFLETLAGELRK